MSDSRLMIMFFKNLFILKRWNCFSMFFKKNQRVFEIYCWELCRKNWHKLKIQNRKKIKQTLFSLIVNTFVWVLRMCFFAISNAKRKKIVFFYKIKIYQRRFCEKVELRLIVCDFCFQYCEIIVSVANLYFLKFDFCRLWKNCRSVCSRLLRDKATKKIIF